MQTILLGQPQFRAILASPDLEQLRQRVLASYHLGPLTEAETRAYIEHRLKRVGWTGDPHWEDAAFTAVYRHTGGIPRRINTLCSRVLLYGALEETHTITGPMVEMTADELSQDLGAGLAAPQPATIPAMPTASDTEQRRAGAPDRGAGGDARPAGPGVPPRAGPARARSTATDDPAQAIRNAMTVDVEDYFQVQAFAGCVDRAALGRHLPARVEANVDRILAPVRCAPA